MTKKPPLSAGDAGDTVSVPGLGRSLGGGTHSSTLAWKIPWTEEPGRLQSMGPQRVRHAMYIYISVLSLSQRIYTHTHARTCMHTHTHIYNLGDFESTYFSLFPVLVCTLFQSQNNEMLFNGPILNPLCTFSFPVIMTAQYFSVMKKLRLRKMSEYTQGHRARKS